MNADCQDATVAWRRRTDMESKCGSEGGLAERAGSYKGPVSCAHVIPIP